jgi:predicted dehydrogenase
MSRLRIGIIGTGRISELHASAFAALPDVQLAAAASRGQDKLRAFAERHRIPQSFASTQEMLASGNVDAVLVLVSADQVERVATEVLKARMPVFLEKPPALTTQGVRALRDLAAAQGTPNMVGFNRRFYGVMREAFRISSEEGPLHGIVVEAPERVDAIRKIGHPAHVIEHWLPSNASHCIDLLRYFGGEVLRGVFTADGERGSLDRSLNAILRFEKGTTGQYVAHWRAPGPWRVQLYGTDWRVLLEPLERGLVQRRGHPDQQIAIDPNDERFKAGFYEQARFFVDLCRGLKTALHPASDLSDSVKTFELIDAFESASDKRWVDWP